MFVGIAEIMVCYLQDILRMSAISKLQQWNFIAHWGWMHHTENINNHKLEEGT